jgi:flagellar protein FliO/FliZ
MRRKCLLIVLIAVLLMQVFTLASLAAEFEEFNKVMDEQEQKPEESHNLWLDLLKLVLILGLIVGATWSLVKVFSKQLGKKMQGTWLQVVDEVALGQNRGIVLCEIGEKLYALGVTDHNISFLFEVDNSGLLEEISQNELLMEKDASTKQEMRDKISLLLKKLKPSKPERKDFRFIMEEQVQRLQDISHKSMEDNKAGRRRNGDDDQA